MDLVPTIYSVVLHALRLVYVRAHRFSVRDASLVYFYGAGYEAYLAVRLVGEGVFPKLAACKTLD